MSKHKVIVLLTDKQLAHLELLIDKTKHDQSEVIGGLLDRHRAGRGHESSDQVKDLVKQLFSAVVAPVVPGKVVEAPKKRNGWGHVQAATEQILSMRKTGASGRKIASQLGYSKSAVFRILNDNLL